MKRTIKARSEEITLKEALEDFLQAKEDVGLSPSTILSYKKSFLKFDADLKGDCVFPSQLDEGIIARWNEKMKKDEIAVTSVNHYLRDLRAFSNWLADKGYIKKRLEIREKKAQEELPKFFSDKDLEILIEKPRPKDSFTDWRTWAIVQTVLATGVRESTVVNMKVADFNFKDKSIVLAHTKNKKAQMAVISASLENCLKEYIRKFDVGTYMFCNVGGEQLTTHGLRQAFRRYCLGRGVEQYNFHGLRHSFARNWIRNGGNPMALKSILGHSTMTMVSHYVNLYATDIKDNYEDFSALDVLTKNKRRTNKVNRND